MGQSQNHGYLVIMKGEKFEKTEQNNINSYLPKYLLKIVDHEFPNDINFKNMDKCILHEGACKNVQP